jgi:hypothetical protein
MFNSLAGIGMARALRPGIVACEILTTEEKRVHPNQADKSSPF